MPERYNILNEASQVASAAWNNPLSNDRDNTATVPTTPVSKDRTLSYRKAADLFSSGEWTHEDLLEAQGSMMMSPNLHEFSLSFDGLRPQESASVNPIWSICLTRAVGKLRTGEMWPNVSHPQPRPATPRETVFFTEMARVRYEGYPLLLDEVNDAARRRLTEITLEENPDTAQQATQAMTRLFPQ